MGIHITNHAVHRLIQRTKTKNMKEFKALVSKILENGTVTSVNSEAKIYEHQGISLVLSLTGKRVITVYETNSRTRY